MKDCIEKTESISSLEYYKLARSQIEHEDNLVGQRQSWFISSQSFLFTAYAITASNLKASATPWVNAQQHGIFLIIPMVSMVICTLTMAGSVAGLLAMRNLRRLHHLTALDPELGLPPIQGYRRTFFLGQASPVLLPIVFFAVWVILLLRGLAH